MYACPSTTPIISAALGAGTFYIPFYFAYDTTIQQIGIKVNTTHSKPLYIGIYDSNNYVPNSLLFSDTILTDTIGIKTVSCSVSLSAFTLYWVALYNPYGTNENTAHLAHINCTSTIYPIALGYKINYNASTDSYSIDTDSSCNHVLLNDQYAGSAMRNPSPSINTSAASYTNQQYPIIFLYEGLTQQSITFDGTAHYDGSYYYGQGTP
jgi:hypothetical protein